MKYRKLRIAWSVMWGVAAVLLCLLWIRGYWYVDYFSSPPHRGPYSGLQSHRGHISIYTFGKANPALPPHGWFEGWEITNMTVIDYYAHDHGMGEHRTLLGFEFVPHNPGFYFRFPHWFAIGIAALLAGLPWAARLNQFSLRTLLVAMTMLAIIFGFIIWIEG